MLALLPHTGYTREAIAEALRSELQRHGLLQRLAARGERVLLKPNFVMPAPPDDASTTHPQFYMAVATVLQDAGFQVGIGESPAFGSCQAALAAHGVLDECRQRGIEVVAFRQARHYPGVSSERHYRRLSVAVELGAWHSVLNLPKLKTHRQFVFTGACKNLYGCVVGKRKFIRHNLCGNDPVRFARMILANAAHIDCPLHIGDGIEALHVMGPRGGQRFALGAIVISDDPLEHDLAQCWLTALAPQDTPLFQAAGAARLAALQAACAPALAASGLTPAQGFRHAPQVHISFSPWAVLRSTLRTLRHRLAAPAAG